jgi:hypothetical protein
VPTIYDQDGFRVEVRLPPREKHRNAHVHVIVRKQHEVSVELPIAARPSVYVLARSKGISERDFNRAVRIVEDNAAKFQGEWEKYHGKL